MLYKSASRIKQYILFLLLIQFLAISFAFAQTQGITEYKLNNGLTVLMKEVHAAPVFTAQVWFKVGSRDEHTGITGISHILEHMLFNSSKNYKKGEITGMIRKRGGIDNAATWTDFTYYWELLQSDHLEFALKSLGERLGNALLLDKEFQNERTVVLSEMEGRENDPGTLLYQGVNATAFTAAPYQWPTIGWRSDVENISHQQLLDYYHSWYYPNNATLVLVGDFDSQKALGLIKKYLGTRPAHQLPRQPYTVEPPQHGQRDITIRKEGTAERVLLGYHVPGIADPDSYALTVLDQILSGGRSSRLYQTLVDTQLASSAWSSAGGQKDPSLFLLGATARQGVTSDQLKKAILEQVDKAKNSLPTDQEMQAAKNQLEASLVFQNDSVSDQGEQLGYYATVAPTWKYFVTLIPKLKAVTAQDVQRVAQKYLKPENLTVGRFIPTGPSAEGMGNAPVGPLEHSLLPDAKRGVYYHETPGLNQKKTVKGSPAKINGRHLAKPTRVVLDNGMVVIVEENHANPTVAITGSLKAGSYFDPKGKNGVADLTADMITRGTQKRSALELSKASEYLGAQIHTSASVESASVGAKSLSKDFPMMLDLLSDELKNASFPQDQITKAKGETASALEESKESPEDRASRMFYNATFPEGHPYHQLTIDQAQNELKGINRDDLVSFYKAYYRPDTTILVIVGDVDTNKALDLVKQYFGDWTANGPKPTIDIPTIMPSGQPKQIVIPMMDKSEVDVVYGHPFGIKRSNPDFYAARIMNQIIGGAGALSSILGEDIREKQGLAYNVYSTFDSGLGAGPWYAILGTNAKNADKAIAALKREVETFRNKGATKDQFEEAREFTIGVFPIALETNEGVAGALRNAEFYGLGLDYLRNYAKIYRSVTLQQVNAAAKKYLHPEDAALVIAGPYQAKPASVKK